MISVLLNSRSTKELSYMVKFSYGFTAKISEERWEFHSSESVEEILKFLMSSPILDIACVDVTSEKGISLAKNIRSRNGNTLIMLIADSKVSPVNYITPDIMAASLLLRPFDGNGLKEFVRKSYLAYTERYETDAADGDVFVIESKDGRTVIPYKSIYCFEAQQKKISLICDRHEYTFYDTIENLMTVLPRYFVRSHRSNIVNTKKITKIMLSQGIIVLNGDFEVPLSRSYRQDFKNFGKGGEAGE